VWKIYSTHSYKFTYLPQISNNRQQGQNGFFKSGWKKKNYWLNCSTSSILELIMNETLKLNIHVETSSLSNNIKKSEKAKQEIPHYM
jgi:hypothetical protein